MEFLGATPVPLHLEEERGFAFGAETLRDLISERTRVIILCSASNPTGGVLSKEDLYGIAAVIRERCRPDVRVFADEIYEQILFDGESHHSIVCEEGMEEVTVLASGHSKSYAMTGWRLGWGRVADSRRGRDLQTAQHQRRVVRAAFRPGGGSRGV